MRCWRKDTAEERLIRVWGDGENDGGGGGGAAVNGGDRGGCEGEKIGTAVKGDIGVRVLEGGDRGASGVEGQWR